MNLLPIIMSILVITAPVIHPAIRRCAIDIGSGMIKMQDADIDEAGKLIRIGAPFFAKAALANHYFEHGTFTDAIQQEALLAFESILNECKKRDVYNLGIVATAIFRKAGKAGELLLQKLRDTAYKTLGDKASVSIQIITQELEGETGFLTANALTNGDKNTMVVCDVGNASFQIITQNETSLTIHGANLGNASATKMFIQKTRNASYTTAQAVNPITHTEKELFCNYLIQWLTETATITPSLKEKLQNPTTQVVSIGGPFCIFALGSRALEKTTYNQEEVKVCIDNYLGKDNTSAAIQQLDSQEPETAVVKLCLLYSIMKAFDINTITYTASAGNTLGILLSPQIWEKV